MGYVLGFGLSLSHTLTYIADMYPATADRKPDKLPTTTDGEPVASIAPGPLPTRADGQEEGQDEGNSDMAVVDGDGERVEVMEVDEVG